jgi:N-acetylglucosaminyldiphosphoundecaprenol N-acetyl-beta-D-mannosaminyltransferase
VGPVCFSVVPLHQAIDLVWDLGTTLHETGHAVHFCNAYNVALADDNAEYAALINAGDLVFSDGTPVVWAGKRLHGDVADRWTRVYGPDVMTGILVRTNQAVDTQPRHYFLGSTPETLSALLARIERDWPNARVVGYESPPFTKPSPADLAERDTRIRKSGATLVWVGLGTPKQDFEVQRVSRATGVTALAVGAAFDFLAGTKSQAPTWMQHSGMEWAFRLASEPRRLAKRYFWGNPRFVLAAARTDRHAQERPR